MPVSRNRKNHKQKVKARNQKIEAARKSYAKKFESEMMKYLDEMSASTENKMTEKTSGPIQ
jgi:hypothetical protein